MASEALTKLSIDNANNNSVSLNADELINPVRLNPVSIPKAGSLPDRNIVNNVARETGEIIAAETEDAKELKKLRREFGALSKDGSLTDVFNQSLRDSGVSEDSFAELKDIRLQLSDQATASELTKTGIAGAAGQTLGQAGREITQEDREEAVRSAGLAARAAVLQGSIETAQAAATQAVNIAYQDRTLKNQNLTTQINDLSGVVDEQTQQLLDEKQREIDADNEKIKELKSNIAAAMVSGASQSEITQLNDPDMSDEAKLALAQGITARGATEERGLEIEGKRLSNVQARLNIQETQQAINEINEESGEDFSNIVKEIQSLDVSNDKIENLSRNLQSQIDAGDYVGAIASLENTIESSFTGEVKTKFANQRTDFGVMSQLRDAIQIYSDGGGDLGLLTGKAEEISNKLLGVTTNPELTALATQLEREFQTYRTNATGAAFSPEESRDYAKVNPSSKKSLDLNLAIIDGALKTLDDRIVETVTRRVPSATSLYDADATGVTSTNLPDNQIDEEYDFYLEAINLER